MSNKLSQALMLAKNAVKESVAKMKSDVELKTTNDIEDALLLTIEVKHEIISLGLLLRDLSAEASHELNKGKSKISFGESDDVIKDRGFSKITQDLRSSFQFIDKELSEISRVCNETSGLIEYTDKVLRAIEGDENNYRKILDIRDRSQRGL